MLVAGASVRAGFRAQITVRADALTTGSEEQDHYARIAVLKVRAFPEVRFTIDSVVRITERADTLSGTAIGVLTLLGVVAPIEASVVMWSDTVTGGMRMLAKTRIPASHLSSEYGMSEFALQSIGAGTWRDVWMGLDLVMKSEGR